MNQKGMEERNIYKTALNEDISIPEVEFITFTELRSALTNLYRKKGLPVESLDELAQYLLNLFGYSTIIADNNIPPADRNILYTLQDEGIITTTHEDVRLINKRLYTLFYWKLNTRRILNLIYEPENTEEKEDTTTKEDVNYIYESIPENVWAREKEY